MREYVKNEIQQLERMLDKVLIHHTILEINPSNQNSGNMMQSYGLIVIALLLII